MISNTPKSPQDHSGVWFPPPLFYVLIFLIALPAQELLPLPPIAASVGLILGIAFLLCGTSLNLWSIDLFRQKKTSLVPIKPTHSLVRSGAYGLSRNPMYLGLLSTYTGVSLIQHRWWPILLIPVVIVVINGLVIRKEELYLARTFGEEYESYKRDVRRWV